MNYSNRSQNLKNLIPLSERLLSEDVPKGYIDMTASVPPFPVPGVLLNAAQEIIRSENMSYTHTPGLESLRKIIAETQGIPHALKQVTVTTGTSEALFCTLAALVEEGDECLIPDLSLQAHASAVEFFGATVVRYSIDITQAEQANAETIMSHVTENTKLILINNPLIATGQYISLASFTELTDFCRRRGIYIVVDESFSEITYKQSCRLPLANEEPHIIRFSSMTKLFNMSGMRIGWLIAAPEVSEAINSVRYISSTCANTLSQRIALRMLEGKGLESRERILEILSSRRKLMLETLKNKNLNHFPTPIFGYYIFLNYQKELKTTYSSVSFVQMLKDRKSLIVTPGSYFGPAGEGHIRISFTNTEDNIQKSVTYIRELIDELNL